MFCKQIWTQYKGNISLDTIYIYLPVTCILTKYNDLYNIISCASNLPHTNLLGKPISFGHYRLFGMMNILN